MPIAIKWSIAIGTLISLVMGTLGWFLITQQNRIHMQEVEIFGTALVEQLSHSSSEPLLADDLFNLQGLVSRQTQSRDIVGAAIIGLRGLRADSGIVPEKLDDADEQNSRVWFWRDEDGISHPVITFTTPIRFRDTTAGQAIITLDREFLDRHQLATIRIIAYATLGLILIAALLSYALSRRLSRPITLLAQAGEKKIGADFAESIDAGRRDEIGQVYAHFDRMSLGLLEKDQVEAALSRYVSPVVANKILSNLAQPRLPNQQVDGSVLFCDIVGFTEFSENLPPDEVATMLNLYLGYIAEAANLSHGFVDKFIGDSAMILFGVPDSDPKHGQHAIRCAWLIQALVKQLNRQRVASPIHFRIGINSGVMLAGNIGIPERLEFTVVGDTVNLASRLCSLAPADGIIMSETTAIQPHIDEMIELTEQAPIQVRGRKNPVTPSIAGTPSSEFGHWLMNAISTILDNGTRG
ncbi:MAG: adenylate/guanylate cyclase domain-containing protein [Gammaproteobacteria bacterium (ex Lamellibrachia satsuma)]|nr:MAG: adenylate/guanylate cyclase domain-containing protein [Gammaproteobacteria bacterium (ex Lamellibrachia satsuma)]